MPQHLRTQNSNTLKKNTGHSNPATSESVTARKILDLWIILMKRKGVILLPHLFFPPIWLAKSSFMVAYVTPSWISVAPWPGSLAISLVCTNWQPCGRTEAQEGVKIYPLIFKHGNGNSPINGGFDGNIIYKWGNHKWWEFCWTIHDVSHELPSTACPWRIFNLEIQKLQMFIAGNIWKKNAEIFGGLPQQDHPELIFLSPSMQYFAASLSGPPSPGAGLPYLAGRWVCATRQFDGKNDDSPVDLGKTNPDMAMEQTQFGMNIHPFQLFSWELKGFHGFWRIPIFVAGQTGRQSSANSRPPLRPARCGQQPTPRVENWMELKLSGYQHDKLI